MRERVLLALWLAVTAAFAVAAPHFASLENLQDLARASCENLLLALGALTVLRARAIDLSCGATLALSALGFGAVNHVGLGWPCAALAAILCGAICGLGNGLLVVVLRLPPLVATLATLATWRGLAEGATGGYRVFSSFPDGVLALAHGGALGIPSPVFVVVPVALLLHVVLSRAALGQELAAIGLAPGAARHAGVQVGRRLCTAFVIAGALAGTAGLLQAVRLGQAKADMGLGAELVAITVAVLGGASLHGGRGSVPGTLLALACLATWQNGVRLVGMPSEVAGIGVGTALLLTIAIDRDAAHTAAPSSAGTLRMSNRQLAVLVLAILAAGLLVFLGLGRVADALRTGSLAAPESRPRKHVTVAMLPKNKSDPYFTSCRQGAEEAAKELGIDLLWDGPSDTDAGKQNELVDAWIARGVDVIAASVENKDALSTVLLKARTKGIRVLTWDADARPEARDFLVNQATAVGIGETLADEAARLLGETGRYAIVTASLTAENQNSWIAALKARMASAHPKCTLAQIRPSDGMRDKAFAETKNILGADPDVRVVVALASAAVPGAAEAVKQLGLAGKVQVIGLSVPSLCRAYVHEGVIPSITLWNTIDLGYLTVHAAAQLANGALKRGATTLGAGRLGTVAIDGDQVLLGKPFLFTKQNIDLFGF